MAYYGLNCQRYLSCTGLLNAKNCYWRGGGREGKSVLLLLCSTSPTQPKDTSECLREIEVIGYYRSLLALEKKVWAVEVGFGVGFFYYCFLAYSKVGGKSSCKVGIKF